MQNEFSRTGQMGEAVWHNRPERRPTKNFSCNFNNIKERGRSVAISIKDQILLCAIRRIS
jgi:hypothetical protein